ncbi:MAG TPA: NAD(P)-binding domain-containing protein [Labilithrix sp.]|nr:NAD(P)-binding domain-containing protein [Labilithrix sp.]
MKIGILGTGVVGETIATKLVASGHDVKMGARSATNEKAAAWVAKAGSRASQGTFADAARYGELVFLCTKGEAAVEVARSAGKETLDGKILVDISNPLDFSKGMPPTVFTKGDDSLAEQIQRELPGAKVVKALNTVNAEVMVDPARLGGDHDIFVSGNDAAAKATVSNLLREQFGWKSVIDLGDVTTARGTEHYLPLWLRLMFALGTADFNIKIVKK